ncbi:nicotinamide-nucleotide amidase [Devosia enhydra]|uniref:Nicotinamide-nucleotide amidase n=1 Tax=Devosia enhydra TaxID=665118 RepID=A0A1K2HUJ0_9HYPH|nr:CinA family protein [Devosia enhydra]SFZ82125.1 nicotinamide-nucleotide amidase [Devosia enhydra]
MQMPPDIDALAREAVAALIARRLTVSTAESCTGGLIAGALTSVAGSSEVVYGGFVTYANEAKIAMIGVPWALLKSHGAVSKEVAIAMAEGALAAAGTHIAVAVTGVAGPGASEAKPAGLVHFALAGPDGVRHLQRQFSGLDRAGVRHATVVEALRMIIAAAKSG